MESVHHVNVPLRAGKKMKKRKELDALVAHSAGKRACNGGLSGGGGGGGGGCANSGCGIHKRPAGGASSQDQLLSESTDEHDDYWSVKSSGGHHHGHGGHGGGTGGGGGGGGRGGGPRATRLLLRRRVCGSLLRACTAALVFACVVATVTVMWLFIDIREQVTSLRSKLDQVVAGNQRVPEDLQECHSLSRGLQQNQTLLFVKFEAVESQLANFSNQLAAMQHSLRVVQDKLEGAPELVNVPQNINELKGNVAKFGSYIKDFDTRVTELKTQTSSLQEFSNALDTNITNIQKTVANLLNASQQSHGTPEENSEEKKALLALTNQLSQNITRVNDTLNSKIQYIIDDQKIDHTNLGNLQELGQNVSARITTLEGECPKLSATKLILQNITDRVTNQDLQLHELSNSFLLLQSNNSLLNAAVNNIEENIARWSSKPPATSQSAAPAQTVT